MFPYTSSFIVKNRRISPVFAVFSRERLDTRCANNAPPANESGLPVVGALEVQGAYTHKKHIHLHTATLPVLRHNKYPTTAINRLVFPT